MRRQSNAEARRDRRHASWAATRGGLLALIVLAASPHPTHAGGDPAETAGMLDLSRTVVVVPDGLSRAETRAVAMLVEEVERRSGVRWAVASAWCDSPDLAVVAVGQGAALLNAFPRHAASLARIPPPEATRAEGYRIRTVARTRAVLVAGDDPRGVLFGVGRLLRELRPAPGRVLLPEGFQVATSPAQPLRGHQLGYRPKTNSYDGWDLDQWERYIRDLAVFGTNAIELIPPRSDDDPDSPHFPRPPLEMMVGMSRLADAYGLDVWIWYPAMDENYADPKVVESAVREWGEVFRKLPRIDAVFVPGGDPGHTRPDVLLAMLQKQAESLRRHHPKAQVWVSPQGFDQKWLDEFLRALAPQPSWLTGVVHGPQVRVGVAELRKAVPRSYPLRLYPDITHCLSCQYPVPDWDLAFARTLGREPINPRPLAQESIFRSCQGQSVGFVTYSEGCNDDVNKFVWSGLGWDPDTPVIEVLRQYSRYFLGERYTDGFAQGLLALERNWSGPLLTNAEVETTLRQFQDLERNALPEVLRNWRFQQALYRAYYDAHVRDRLIAETALEAEAKGILRQAGRIGSLRAIDEARAVLDRALTHPVSADRRERVHELAEALFQSIRMQLSVDRHRAIASGRGATLDTLDAPLNDRPWLEARLAALRNSPLESERLEGIAFLLDLDNAGPGGFHDALGDPSRQPHLVRGPGFALDPDARRSALVGFGSRPGWPLSWCRNAQSLYDAPLRLHYEGLDREARYRVRVVYAGDNFQPRIRLDADGHPVHPLIKKPDPVDPLEFAVPAESTRDGSLTLEWTPEQGRGGNGRGCQVAEVWLLKR